jgi:hypothetical protein
MKVVVPPPPSPPLLIWWILWFAMTNGLIVQRFFLAKGFNDGDGSLALVAIAPLLVSAGIRFLLLPRMKTKLKAFPIFIVGLATAEACGLLGIFLGGTHIDELFGASLVMLLLYAPLFARRYDGGGSVDAFRQS